MVIRVVDGAGLSRTVSEELTLAEEAETFETTEDTVVRSIFSGSSSSVGSPWPFSG
jgi:hypothetical protein